ncbi:MAG: single-stranded DNA-binding protein [Nocardioides sp.]|uniref:single-stranded DNA-binding protein n=1 Tax=Nocardioides sp. TaxID=35761 RepID=UPI0039E35484
MTQSMITLQGYVGGEPVVRSAGGHSVANFRVACTPRRLNKATGTWSDGQTQWFTVNAWRQLGQNVARSLRKGDAVVVHGRLQARAYVNRDGVEVTAFEIEATVVGHDLNRGASVLVKNEPRTGAGQPRDDVTFPDRDLADRGYVDRGYGATARQDDQIDDSADLDKAVADWSVSLGEPPDLERGADERGEVADAESEAPAA